MRAHLLSFAGSVLRGYGQLFFANHPLSGALFVAGLFLVSPEHTLWGLLAACLVTAAAWRWCRTTPDFGAGLFAVNGALLGSSGVYFPEVPPLARGALTLLGSVALALMLVTPSVCFLRRRGFSLTLFALPSVLAAWVNLLLACSLGLYDPHLYRGWHNLAAGDFAEAKRQFAAVQVSSKRGKAYQQDGLGWAEFRLGNYPNARNHFRTAIQDRPDFWDAQDGAGWCCFRLGQDAEARVHFELAVAGDPLRGDSWDGLGWLNLAAGDATAADYCFRRALCAAPLLADAHVGLSRCPQRSSSVKYSMLAAAIQARVAQPYQHASSLQWLCWALILAGIAYHSRTSLIVAATALIGCIIAGTMFAGLRACLSDLPFLYNLFPLLLALGGQYLRIAIPTVIWSVLAALLLALLWAALTPPFVARGLPLLCLPFHVLLAGSLLLFWFRHRRIFIPLEIAVRSPSR